MSSDFPKERDKALVESTAQSIFNTLRELEGGRSVYEKRWPWELLQNAVDVAKPSGIDCKFILTDKELSFIHDGIPFKMREIAHLIYHGSTKTDEPNKIRFGTGFITTHLLSRKTHVRGVIEDGRRFEFELDREGASWRQLEENMGETERGFVGSLGSEVHLPDGAAVEYAYPLTSEGLQTAIAGINAVKTNIAFVLALNDNLSSVTVADRGIVTKWVKLIEKTKSVNDKVIIVPIQSTTNGQEETYSVAVAHKGPIAAVLQLLGDYPEYSIKSMKSVPKLFYDFPLATTDDFPLPVIINSPSFVPLEKRDGLLLGPDLQEDNLHNKRLIEDGIELLQEIVLCTVNLKCQGLFRLARIGMLPDKTWLDHKWLKEALAKLIPFIRDSSLVEQGLTSDNKPILLPPKKTYIPYDTESETLLRIWDLAQKIFHHSLPTRTLATEWAETLGLWSKYLEIQTDKLDEALTLGKLAIFVSQLGSLDNIREKLKEETNPSPKPIEWLNSLLELICERTPQLLDTLNLVPNQNGLLKKKTEVHRDENIDDMLKDIDRLLGRDIRATLCDRKVTRKIQDSLSTYQQEALLLNIIKMVKTKSEAEYSEEQYVEANANLFSWLANKERLDLLGDNFPIMTHLKDRTDKSEQNYMSHLLNDQPLLIPVSLWQEAAQPYANVFPSQKILSDIYNTEEIDAGIWKKIADKGLIVDNLFVKVKEVLDDLKIRKLLVQGELTEQEEHSTDDETELTSIVFLEDRNWGMIDMVRRSKSRAKDFLKFLLGYVIQTDTSWRDIVSIQCSCADTDPHTIYPSKWLYVLKSREWVPISRNKEEQPTSENLAPLFQKDPELLKYLNEDQPSSFLSVLGVSPSQIMMASQSAMEKLELDKAFVKLLLATNSNVHELNRLAQVYQDPNWRLKMEEAYDLQKRVKRNQLIGRNVEQILRNLLQNSLPEEQFKVHKINRAADIGIDIDIDFEFDLLDEDYQPFAVGLSIQETPFTIEVKSTHLDYVRITMPQAQDAVEKMESFVLCVVELPSGWEHLLASDAEKVVREKAKFVLRVGSELQDKFDEAKQFQTMQEEIKSAPMGNVAIDTSDLQIRLRLGKKLWTEEGLTGMNFSQFIEFLLGSLSAGDSLSTYYA